MARFTVAGTAMGAVSLAGQLAMEEAGAWPWLHHHDTFLPLELPALRVPAGPVQLHQPSWQLWY